MSRGLAAGARAVAAAAVVAGCGGGAAAPAAPIAATCPLAPVVIASQADVDQFALCPISRGLTFRTGSELDLAASHLRHVRRIETGDLVIGPSVGLTAVELPELAEIDGAIRVVGNGSLITLSLPALTRVGSVTIAGNVELRMVAVPGLAEVGHGLVIDRTPSLTVIDASALHTVGGELEITDAPELTVFEAASLVRATGVRLTRTGLDPAQVDALHAISSPGADPR